MPARRNTADIIATKREIRNDDEAIALGLFERFKRAPAWKKEAILLHFVARMLAA